MQKLENLLFVNKYIVHIRTNPSTNATEEIFFCHPASYDLWRAFPHVLMIDATYKTNVYRLPFVQIVGVTSTHKTFCIAHAFLSKEREENFVWMLEMLRGLLHKCMEPRVILTDRDLALMNACKRVFPNATRCLCRWHIGHNIAKHCKASFKTSDWKKFTWLWATLCESPSIAVYEYNHSKLYKRLVEDNRGSKLQYMQIGIFWVKRAKHGLYEIERSGTNFEEIFWMKVVNINNNKSPLPIE
jgi:histone-lysine N-methyltransferase SETD2